jgi:hypothetical protein
MEVVMTYESRLLAGILLMILPTVMFGGVSILSLLTGDPTYMKNPLRQDLWRAGHAHAGVWLILALVVLRYVDEANLSNAMKRLVRGSLPIAAILVPAAFFLSVLSPDATAPNSLIYLAYVGAVLLAVGVLVLGIGLVRRPAQRSRQTERASRRACDLPGRDGRDAGGDGQPGSTQTLGSPRG